jgi:hypothetical protein
MSELFVRDEQLVEFTKGRIIVSDILFDVPYKQRVLLELTPGKYVIRSYSSRLYGQEYCGMVLLNPKYVTTNGLTKRKLGEFFVGCTLVGMFESKPLLDEDSWGLLYRKIAKRYLNRSLFRVCTADSPEKTVGAYISMRKLQDFCEVYGYFDKGVLVRLDVTY